MGIDLTGWAAKLFDEVCAAIGGDKLVPWVIGDCPDNYSNEDRGFTDERNNAAMAG